MGGKSREFSIWERAEWTFLGLELGNPMRTRPAVLSTRRKLWKMDNIKTYFAL